MEGGKGRGGAPRGGGLSSKDLPQICPLRGLLLTRGLGGAGLGRPEEAANVALLALSNEGGGGGGARWIG